MSEQSRRGREISLRVKELIKEIKSLKTHGMSKLSIMKIIPIGTPLELWYFDGKYVIPPLPIQVKDPICFHTRDIVSKEMRKQWGDRYIGWIHIDSKTKKCYLLGADWLQIADLLVDEELAYYYDPTEDTT